MTLKLKSGPEKGSNAQKAIEQEYLSTIPRGKLNPEEVLAQFGSLPVILIAVQVTPQNGFVGRQEERGAWVHKFWSVALMQMPGLQGCRMGWDSVFFIAPMSDFSQVKERFRRMLCSVRDPNLKIWCILSEASGSPDEKGRFLYHKMQHDLTVKSEINRFPHRLIDGIDEQHT